MRLLLDTHIWIWTIDRPNQLNQAVIRQIENPRNELYLSPASIWEASLIERRGRLHTKFGFEEWLTRALAHSPLQEAPFNFAVAREAAAIQLQQPDPGDTFLAATARVFDLTLVTADPQLIACSWLKTLANE